MSPISTFQAPSGLITRRRDAPAATAWHGGGDQGASRHLPHRRRLCAGHVIDVLLGTENEKTKRFGHADMPVFGVGWDIPVRTWDCLILATARRDRSLFP
jgi:hypothetical protein